MKHKIKILELKKEPNLSITEPHIESTTDISRSVYNKYRTLQYCFSSNTDIHFTCPVDLNKSSRYNCKPAFCSIDFLFVFILLNEDSLQELTVAPPTVLTGFIDIY